VALCPWGNRHDRASVIWTTTTGRGFRSPRPRQRPVRQPFRTQPHLVAIAASVHRPDRSPTHQDAHPIVFRRMSTHLPVASLASTLAGPWAVPSAEQRACCLIQEAMAAKREHGFRMRLFSTASSRFVRDRALGFMCTRWFVLRHPPPHHLFLSFIPPWTIPKCTIKRCFFFFFWSLVSSLSPWSLSLSPSL
jgi:hypothetical protein